MARKKGLKSLIELVIAVIIAVFTVALIQQLFFLPVGVIGPSMLPTINESGDTAYVQKKGYDLEINDVIVFYRPLNEAAYDLPNPADAKFSLKEFFVNFLHLRNSINTDNDSASDGNFICVIKRVIGLPGDTIEIRDAVLYRNGEEVDDFPMTEKTIGYGVQDVAPVLVGEGEIYVLGDNRDMSYDSEDYGVIESDWVLGKVLMIISRGGKFGIKFM